MRVNLGSQSMQQQKVFSVISVCLHSHLPVLYLQHHASHGDYGGLMDHLEPSDKLP